jgi:16S rRNA (uracil1498-N3)-methyltransferase
LSKIGNDIKVRIHRVHTDQALDPGHEITLAGQTGHYLSRVLRVTAGQTIVVFNGDGRDYVTEVVRSGRNELILSVISSLPAVKESRLGITVVQAIGRGERMDQTLQKCTELGVNAFQPLFSERVEVRLKAEKLARRLDHWRAVVVSACEQCGRAVVPEVREPLVLRDWLVAGDVATRLVLAPGAESPLTRLTMPKQLQLVVGPEGGFSEAELDLMDARGVQAVSLGPRVLRTETAAPAAVAVVQALAGDLG